MVPSSGRRRALQAFGAWCAMLLAASVVATTNVAASPDVVDAVAVAETAAPVAESIGVGLPTPPEVAAAAGGTARHLVTTTDVSALDTVLAALTRRGVTPLDQWTGAITGVVADLSLELVETIRLLPGVLHVERDKPVALDVDQANPPWGLDRIDQRARPLDSRYSTARSGTGVTAYIIDSGLNFSHLDFSGRVTAAAYISFPNDTTQAADCLGHGTHVTGTLGGTTYGVAKNVSIVPVKVFPCSSSTSTSNIVNGINWVIAHHLPGVPAVANLSLGSSAVSTTLDAAVQALVNDGITTVVAAGNDNLDACATSPARVPAAITVAASDSLDRRASFSNYGTCNDLFAPGVAVLSAGLGTTTATTTMSGTSMATPHVAGAAALTLGAAPASTPAQVWQALDALTTTGAITGGGAQDPNKLLYVEPLAPQEQSLQVTVAGTGVGTVTSVPAGVDCTASCTTLFATDTSVTLTATPAAASVFEGWSGSGCSGTGSCVVTMNAARSVTATFSTPTTFDLVVTPGGDGTGIVLSSPSGIDCGSTCSATFPADTVVSLVGSADSGSTFTGWSGAGCTGVETCRVTMDAARSVTATFTSDADKPLVVALDGTGGGTVVSDPAGIDCGTTCTATFPANSTVTLTATPEPESVLTAWSGGGCSGTASCTVTMGTAQSVTATFTPIGELPTPPSAPLAPMATSLRPLTDVGLSWSAPFDGRSPIIDYVVEYSVDDVEWVVYDDGVSTATRATVTGLSRESTYAFRVSAVNGVGLGNPSPPSNDVLIPPTGFVPISPVRLFDTRPDEPDGAIVVAKTRVGPSNVLRLQIADVAGVPASGAAAVALNVTVTEPLTPGFVTVYPCGDLPLASNVNFVAGQTVPNSVIAPLSPEGEVCLFSNTPTHLLADISGWFRDGQTLTTVTPVRLFDTRPGYAQGVVTVTKQVYGPSTNGTQNVILRVPVTDLVGITPSAAEVGAVVLNVTATETQAPGFVTVYPCGSIPTVSSLNFVARQTVPNLVIAPVSSDGFVCFFASARTHLLADISGWFATVPGMGDLAPARLFDTRPLYADGAVAVPKVPVGGQNVLRVKVTGRAGVPASGVGAVALNVTATESKVPGFVTVFPCGDVPTASNVNFTAGQTVPNSVIAPVSATGEVCFFANTATHLLADVSAWFPA